MLLSSAKLLWISCISSKGHSMPVGNVGMIIIEAAFALIRCELRPLRRRTRVRLGLQHDEVVVRRAKRTLASMVLLLDYCRAVDEVAELVLDV
jgi:hypothetical protein